MDYFDHILRRSLDKLISSHLFSIPPPSDLTLKVRSVNLLSEKSQWNRKEHHTDKYHGDQLIIRRGRTFQIEIDLSRAFNPKTDKLHLELKTGENEDNLIMFVVSVLFLSD